MKIMMALLLGLTLQTANAEVLKSTADSFAEISSLYQQQVTEPEKTLFVFDIDNTLLTMSQPLGGVAWWDWQSDLLKNHPESNQLFAHNFQDLVKVQNLLFQLVKMDPTDEFVLPFIKDAANQGVSIIGLTARGNEHLSVTIAQLQQNNFINEHQQLIFDAQRMRLSTPNADSSGAIHCAQLSKKPTYYQGIVFLSGEDKGRALQCLLMQSTKTYKTIVFVDDAKQNVESVEKAFSNQSEIRVYDVLYTNENEKEQLFLQNPYLQEETVNQWHNIIKMLKENVKHSNFKMLG